MYSKKTFNLFDNNRMDDNSYYRFELNEYNDGIFNSSINATYIMHLEGNGRLDTIK